MDAVDYWFAAKLSFVFLVALASLLTTLYCTVMLIFCGVEARRERRIKERRAQDYRVGGVINP